MLRKIKMFFYRLFKGRKKVTISSIISYYEYDDCDYGDIE
jgi:hypothetical protein